MRHFPPPAYLRFRFAPGPHSDPISFLHLTGPAPCSPPWTAPPLRAFLQHCSAQSGTVSSYCDEDVWPLQLDRQTCEPWTVSFRAASVPRAEPWEQWQVQYPGLMTHCAWLLLYAVKCTLVTEYHLGSGQRPVCLCHLYICLRWKEWLCAVT